MATQYLAGSTALNKNGIQYSLVHDTCAEAEFASFRITHKTPLNWTVYKFKMSDMEWIAVKTRDF